MLPADGWGSRRAGRWVNDNLVQPDSIVYIVVYGLLIIGFAYFYTAITFDPAKQADTLRKQGGFIPGIRPGSPDRALPGQGPVAASRCPAPCSSPCVALIPSLLLTHFLPGNQVSFSGTSILIAVGVALETMKQIDSQLMMRNYEGFLK